MPGTWTVLLISGSSGTGKSALARALARRRGAEVASADDFRAVLWHVVPPDRDPALHRFRGDPHIAAYPAEAHAERWMGIARSVSAALVPVVGQRLATGEPLVVEGDAVDPALIARAEYAGRAAAGRVRGFVLHEPDPQAIFANVRERGRRAPGRGFGSDLDDAVMAFARASCAYGNLLAAEAARLGVPVLACRPWETLAARAGVALRAR